MEPALSHDLRAFVEAHLGPLTRALPLGTAGATYRVEGAGGVAYLKAHRQPGKHQRERAAYRALAPHLPAPTLLAERTGPSALLLSALPGGDAEPLPADPEAGRALFEAAGRALARLHALPAPEPDPLPLGEAYRRRVAAAVARAQAVLPPAVAPALAAATADLEAAMQAGLRVPCHRDYEPRNWRVAPFGLLDFEHTRPDHWLADLTRLEAWVWPGRPDLREAFFSGYGRHPDGQEQAILHMLSALDAVQTWAWGVEHRDRLFIERGAEAWAGRASSC
jgi:Ser/Thr protein kinase RdoA (MazF antagonist)